LQAEIFNHSYSNLVFSNSNQIRSEYESKKSCQLAIVSKAKYEKLTSDEIDYLIGTDIFDIQDAILKRPDAINILTKSHVFELIKSGCKQTQILIVNLYPNLLIADMLENNDALELVETNKIKNNKLKEAIEKYFLSDDKLKLDYLKITL
jgi:hypothetical protein